MHSLDLAHLISTEVDATNLGSKSRFHGGAFECCGSFATNLGSNIEMSTLDISILMKNAIVILHVRRIKNCGSNASNVVPFSVQDKKADNSLPFLFNNLS